MTGKRTFIIAKEGIILILLSLSLAILSFAMRFYIFGVLLGAFTIFNAFFFRNPARKAPEGPYIVAPADGEVILVKELFEDRFLNREVTKISIFMSIFNVHVNRAPVNGKVEKVFHEDGRFFSANLDKAAESNEKNSLIIQSEYGFPILVVQVAGLVARRIICDVKKGDMMKKGEPFGLICYGSRLDIYLPRDVQVKVSVGAKTKAGETIIGEVKDV